MDDPLSIIQQELSHAGEDSALRERLDRLEQRRITPETEIPPREFLFRLFGKPCFPRGELVALTGKEKSGKTFVSSLLMTLCVRQEALSMLRNTPEQLSVLWYDTEQSEESTQEILVDRIIPMCGAPESFPLDNFNIFNVRVETWKERLPLLELAIERYHSDLVILDGIRDLVDDINDGVLSQEVVERLMHLSSEHNCCIVCVLHQNKSAEDKNLRGWIGTELAYKAFEVYECTKDGDRIFTLSQIRTRKYDILDKLKYTVGEDGIPVLCSVEQILASQQSPSTLNHKPSTEGRAPLNPKYCLGYDGNTPIMDVQNLFVDAFRPGEVKSAVALQAVVMKMANITSYNFYNKRREEALTQGYIVQGTDEQGHIVYTCPNKPKIEELKPVPPIQKDLFDSDTSSGDMPF